MPSVGVIMLQLDQRQMSAHMRARVLPFSISPLPEMEKIVHGRIAKDHEQQKRERRKSPSLSKRITKAKLDVGGKNPTAV